MIIRPVRVEEILSTKNSLFGKMWKIVDGGQNIVCIGKEDKLLEIARVLNGEPDSE